MDKIISIDLLETVALIGDPLRKKTADNDELRKLTKLTGVVFIALFSQKRPNKTIKMEPINVIA